MIALPKSLSESSNLRAGLALVLLAAGPAAPRLAQADVSQACASASRLLHPPVLADGRPAVQASEAAFAAGVAAASILTDFPLRKNDENRELALRDITRAGRGLARRLEEVARPAGAQVVDGTPVVEIGEDVKKGFATMASEAFGPVFRHVTNEAKKSLFQLIGVGAEKFATSEFQKSGIIIIGQIATIADIVLDDSTETPGEESDESDWLARRPLETLRRLGSVDCSRLAPWQEALLGKPDARKGLRAMSEVFEDVFAVENARARAVLDAQERAERALARKAEQDELQARRSAALRCRAVLTYQFPAVNFRRPLPYAGPRLYYSEALRCIRTYRGNALAADREANRLGDELARSEIDSARELTPRALGMPSGDTNLGQRGAQ